MEVSALEESQPYPRKESLILIEQNLVGLRAELDLLQKR
jgi:hypothetical protein